VADEMAESKVLEKVALSVVEWVLYLVVWKVAWKDVCLVAR
jgi:hypothetical protein